MLYLENIFPTQNVDLVCIKEIQGHSGARIPYRAGRVRSTKKVDKQFASRSLTFGEIPNNKYKAYKHHDAISVVDVEGAWKKNLKFFKTLNGCALCFDTIPKEYIKKVIHIRDRARNRGSVTHIPSKKDDSDNAV